MALPDKIVKKLASFWHFLIRDWNAIAAWIASLGYLASSFIPSNSKFKSSYQDFFLTIGVVAVLFTLLELKSLLSSRESATQYRTLRDAGPAIIKCIRENVSKSHKGTCEIQILGGRIRTVGDMMRGILVDIENEYLTGTDVKFTIYCIDPDFVVGWSTPTITGTAFAERNQRYRTQISATMDELLSYNRSQIFVSRHISIEIVKYRTFPEIYAFVVGRHSLYVGAFTWNGAGNDFVGPENPCYRVPNTDQTFGDIRHFIECRADFYRVSATIQYTLANQTATGH